MFWVPSSNKIECSTWENFADDFLKLTTGKPTIKSHIDPNLLGVQPAKSSQIDLSLLPTKPLQVDLALQDNSPSALRFDMAVDLGNFADEVIVGQQEDLQAEGSD
jgi:hypothetical protein